MSIQSSIMKATAKVQRRLFDNSVFINGRETDVMHFYTEEDKYGNELASIIDNKKITAIINYPTKIPLDRTKTDTMSIRIDSSRTFFFDVLPISLHAKWTDKVTEGDFVVDIIKDETGKRFPIILQISEMLGSFSTDLIWHEFYCSPFRGIIPEEIKTYIQGLLNND